MGSLNNTIGRTLLRLGAASLTDRELLDHFVAAQAQAAFEEIVRRHGPMVLRVCRRVLQHAQDAEDAFQATFIVLARKASTVARPELLSNWLYGVAQRIASKARTDAAKLRARELSSGDLASNVADKNRPRPEQDLGPTLDKELSRLPDKYRAPLVLCYLEGKSNAEAARLLCCEVRAVEMRLTRGRRLLHGRLARRGLSLSEAALAGLLAQEAASAAAVPTALQAATLRAATLAATGQGLAAAGFSANSGALTDATMAFPGTGAAVPSVALAAAELRDMGRRKALRWVVLGLLLLGVGGIALGVWSKSKSPRLAAQPKQLPALNARAFDSALPLMVLEKRPGHHLMELGRTPTPDGHGVRISAGSHWFVSPVQGVFIDPRRPRPINEADWRAFVAEVRRQEVPGVLLLRDTGVDDEVLAQFAGLNCLESLSVNGDRITDKGLKRLGHLPRLSDLNVVSPQVTSAGLAHFDRLERLYVNSSGVGDEFVDCLKSMPRLRVLELAQTRIGDAGWQKLAAMPALRRGLEHLRIEDGSVGPQGIAALQGLTGLKRLELCRNDIGDPVLQALGAMSQLEVLVIDCCGNHTWRGCPPGDGKPVGPQLLWQIGHIKVVPLSDKDPMSYYCRPRGSVTDRGLSHLARLSRLQKLELAGDQITAAGVQSLAGLSNLRHLRLHGSHITDLCLPPLRSLHELRSLDLVGTRITTNGAAQLGKLPRLQVLLLPWNCSDAERDSCQKLLPGLRVLGRPYLDWRDSVE